MSSLPTVPSSSSRDANAFSETSELWLEDQAVQAQAMRELERTSLAIRLSAIIGRQVSAIGSIIPANISEIANKAAEAAIRSVLNFSFRSLAKTPLRDRRGMHKSLAVLAGAAGGAFGFSGLTVELPFSTTIMLRSIADIARGEGEFPHFKRRLPVSRSSPSAAGPMRTKTSGFRRSMLRTIISRKVLPWKPAISRFAPSWQSQ